MKFATKVDPGLIDIQMVQEKRRHQGAVLFAVAGSKANGHVVLRGNNVFKARVGKVMDQHTYQFSYSKTNLTNGIILLLDPPPTRSVTGCIMTTIRNVRKNGEKVVRSRARSYLRQQSVTRGVHFEIMTTNDIIILYSLAYETRDTGSAVYVFKDLLMNLQNMETNDWINFIKVAQNIGGRINRQLVSLAHEMLQNMPKTATDRRWAKLVDMTLSTSQLLPKISYTEPLAQIIGARAGDVLVCRHSTPTAGRSAMSRLVVGIIK